VKTHSPVKMVSLTKTCICLAVICVIHNIGEIVESGLENKIGTLMISVILMIFHIVLVLCFLSKSKTTQQDPSILRGILIFSFLLTFIYCLINWMVYEFRYFDITNWTFYYNCLFFIAELCLWICTLLYCQQLDQEMVNQDPTFTDDGRIEQQEGTNQNHTFCRDNISNTILEVNISRECHNQMKTLENTKEDSLPTYEMAILM